MKKIVRFRKNSSLSEGRFAETVLTPINILANRIGKFFIVSTPAARKKNGATRLPHQLCDSYKSMCQFDTMGDRGQTL